METPKMSWLEKQLERWKEDFDYRLGELCLDFTEQISGEMNKQHLSRAELAQKLGVSKGYVSKVLNGNANLTLGTMLRFSRALGLDLEIRHRA